jgi:hypothetical protein
MLTAILSFFSFIWFFNDSSKYGTFGDNFQFFCCFQSWFNFLCSCISEDLEFHSEIFLVFPVLPQEEESLYWQFSPWIRPREITWFEEEQKKIEYKITYVTWKKQNKFCIGYVDDQLVFELFQSKIMKMSKIGKIRNRNAGNPSDQINERSRFSTQESSELKMNHLSKTHTINRSDRYFKFLEITQLILKLIVACHMNDHQFCDHWDQSKFFISKHWNFFIGKL